MAERAQPTYVRLLNMLHAIRQMTPINLLNADEELLLDSLIVQWHEKDKITMSELMSDSRFGSQATIYRRIVALRNKGLVRLHKDSQDKRVNFVEPTDVARDYMNSIGQCVNALVLEG